MPTPLPSLILGVDPGTTAMGFGILRTEGRRCRLVDGGVVRLHREGDHHRKLAAIHRRLHEILTEHRPDVFAVEAPFYGKNVQSMLKLGRAQGVAMTVALIEGLPVFEYSPRKIKKAITGHGNASKEQVARMLQQLLGLKERPAGLDQSDAIAAAVCHHYETCGPLGVNGKASGSTRVRSGRSGDWSSWLKSNRDRIA